MTVIPFRHEGDPDRGIDFDLYVDLLVIWNGMERREAELEVWRECRRENLSVVRSDRTKNYKPVERKP